MIVRKDYLRGLTLVLLFILFYMEGTAQKEAIRDEKGDQELRESVLYSDSLFGGDSIRFTIDREAYIDTRAFYDSLKHKANRNSLTSWLYDILMVGKQDNSFSSEDDIDDYSNPYEFFKGQPIRKIHFSQLQVFERYFADTSQQWYKDVGNWIHVPTHPSIIKENLLFEEGDTLDPSLLRDNGRILRNLQYLKDARFIVQPVQGAEDSVDVIVLTQDVWSKGFDVNLSSINAGEIELFDNNFLGLGHKLQANFMFDYFKPSNPGIETFYQVNNIQGSFIDGRLYYFDAFETRRYGLELSRGFYSYKTRMAGGIKVLRTDTRKNIVQEDTTFNQARLDFINHDFWLGYAIPLNSNSSLFKGRNRLIFSGRYRNDRYFENPRVTERYNYCFHDNQIFLANISFSRENFYKSALVYGFGRTEDIPVGDLVGYTFGWENDQFFRRFYSGVHFRHGEFISDWGYLSLGLEAGGFLYNQQIEQGVVDVEARYISKLFNVDGVKMRQFFNVDYTLGFRRFPEESLDFHQRDDIRGMLDGRAFGNKKLVIKSETVGFTDVYYYGFRLALFAFCDIGFLGPEKDFILNNPVQSGFGIGMRLKNENFVFNTFQIRLGFYPGLSRGNRLLMNISGEKNLSPREYTPDPPRVIGF